MLGLLFGIFVCSANGAVSKEGTGRFELGYVYTDEEGNLAVNQETHNLYDGLTISLRDARYSLDNGINIGANLRYISLDNRNIDFSASKAQLFSLSFHHDQYRRIYESGGRGSTDRKSTGGQVSVSPVKYVTLFGGYSWTDKGGTNLFLFQPISDPVVFTSDYTHRFFNIGGQGFFKGRSVRLEYRQSDFDDEAKGHGDRKGQMFRTSASTPFPRYERVVLAGGYDYRLDEMEGSSVELETNQAWGATKARLPGQITVDYRFVFARTDHKGNGIETDNFLNTVSVGRRWNRHGGFRVGYENRIVDDLIDRSESNGFLFSGWINYLDKLFVRTSTATRDKNIVTGSTLIGDEDFTRYRVAARYVDERFGELSAQVRARVKENDDIGSEAEYTSFSTGFKLSRQKYGRLSIFYTYYVGEYESRSADFELSDHVVRGKITPVKYRKVSVTAGGTYYRSRRDLDVEKSSLNLGISYELPEDFHVEAKYSVFNYDDFQAIDLFYTGNVVEVSIARDFSI